MSARLSSAHHLHDAESLQDSQAPHTTQDVELPAEGRRSQSETLMNIHARLRITGTTFEGEPQSFQEAVATHIAEDVDRPPGEDEGIRRALTFKPFDPSVLLLLAPASILGLLARLGLQALGSFDGQSVFPLLYVQGLGCFVMGICLRLKEPLGQFYGPLYTALTTGFCGSLTTFSGWQFDIFGAWINAGGYRRGNLSNAVDGIGISLVTLTLSLGSLVFGFNCASLVAQKLTFPKFPSWWQRYAISLLSALMYGAAIVAYFVLPKRYRHQATAALIFSYPGTLTRYLLSILLNPRYPYLPSGTLAANTFGSALLAASHVLQGVNPPVSPNACSILLGLVDGYCGCLTTVSTFAAEIYDLEWWKGCRYVLLSWGLGQLMMVTIFGIPQWSGHVSNHVTCIM